MDSISSVPNYAPITRPQFNANTLSASAANPRALDPKAIGRSATEVAEGFESLFLYQILEPLEKSSEALFGSGAEGRTFSGLFRQMLAEQVAKSRPLGIADSIESAIEEQQKGLMPQQALENLSRPLGMERFKDELATELQ